MTLEEFERRIVEPEWYRYISDVQAHDLAMPTLWSLLVFAITGHLHGVNNMTETKSEAARPSGAADVKTEMKDGVTKRTTIIEEGNVAPAEATRSFKLRQGMRHTHQGRTLNGGETVELTEAQSRAFRDKFEAVGDDDKFTVKDDAQRRGAGSQTAAEAKQSLREGLESAEGAEAEAKQGLPPPQPAIQVRTTLGGRDPEAPPVDPSAVDPSKQGQQSNEQRRLIDTNQVPPPAPVQAGPPAPTGTTGAIGGVGTPIGTGTPSATATPRAGATGRDAAGPLKPDASPSPGTSGKLG